MGRMEILFGSALLLIIGAALYQGFTEPPKPNTLTITYKSDFPGKIEITGEDGFLHLERVKDNRWQEADLTVEVPPGVYKAVFCYDAPFDDMCSNLVFKEAL